MIPKAPGQRVKTNRLDSLGLAENLRGGQLKSIHVPTTLYRELRHLTQLRDALVSEVVAMKQRIKSVLLMEGPGVSPGSPRQPVVVFGQSQAEKASLLFGGAL